MSNAYAAFVRFGAYLVVMQKIERSTERDFNVSSYQIVLLSHASLSSVATFVYRHYSRNFTFSSSVYSSRHVSWEVCSSRYACSVHPHIFICKAACCLEITDHLNFDAIERKMYIVHYVYVSGFHFYFMTTSMDLYVLFSRNCTEEES